MKDNEQKNKKQTTCESAKKASESVSGDVEEKEQEDLGIDRDTMSDEEYIGALEEKLGQCMAESVMCRGLTQRLQADFDNYRKRNMGLSEDMKKLGISIVVEKMLTVLDSCELARKYLTDPAALTGFNMMETQILSALDAVGLKEIAAEGKEFDAKLMSAVESEKAEARENQVLEVLTKGYTLNEKLLRPAAVKVGK